MGGWVNVFIYDENKDKIAQKSFSGYDSADPEWIDKHLEEGWYIVELHSNNTSDSGDYYLYEYKKGQKNKTDSYAGYEQCKGYDAAGKLRDRGFNASPYWEIEEFDNRGVTCPTCGQVIEDGKDN